MKIVVTGDFVINREYPSILIDKKIQKIFKSADVKIVNLEAPFSNRKQKIIKTGPHLLGNEQSVTQVFEYLNVNLVTLANNHFKDYGVEGVSKTINFCLNNKIDFVGGGEDIDVVRKIHYIKADKVIAIMNYCENEWSSASTKQGGANAFNHVDFYYDMLEAKKIADLIIVIFHGGHEYYQLPSPRIQNLYRYIIDMGASLVIGHHPHCISGAESYKNGKIYYSLGNFLFTKPKKDTDVWYEGMFLEIDVEKNNIECQEHYVKMDKEDYSLTLLEDRDSNDLKNQFEELSGVITNKPLLEEFWFSFVNKKEKQYTSYWSIGSFFNNKYLKSFFSKLLYLFRNRLSYKLYLNLMRCESHRDLSIEILQKKFKKNENSDS